MLKEVVHIARNVATMPRSLKLRTNDPEVDVEASLHAVATR